MLLLWTSKRGSLSTRPEFAGQAWLLLLLLAAHRRVGGRCTWHVVATPGRHGAPRSRTQPCRVRAALTLSRTAPTFSSMVSSTSSILPFTCSTFFLTSPLRRSALPSASRFLSPVMIPAACLALPFT